MFHDQRHIMKQKMWNGRFASSQRRNGHTKITNDLISFSSLWIFGQTKKNCRCFQRVWEDASNANIGHIFYLSYCDYVQSNYTTQCLVCSFSVSQTFTPWIVLNHLPVAWRMKHLNLIILKSGGIFTCNTRISMEEEKDFSVFSVLVL